MVGADAYQGKYSINPYNFEAFNVQEMSFTLNERSMPGAPIETNYADDDYITAFRTLTSSIFPTRIPLYRPYSTNASQYYNGYCFTVFTMTGETNMGELRAPTKYGLTRFLLQFKEALPKAITLILFATFDDEIEIDL